jgi:hypothetical protein
MDGPRLCGIVKIRLDLPFKVTYTYDMRRKPHQLNTLAPGKTGGGYGAETL